MLQRFSCTSFLFKPSWLNKYKLKDYTCSLQTKAKFIAQIKKCYLKKAQGLGGEGGIYLILPACTFWCGVRAARM